MKKIFGLCMLCTVLWFSGCFLTQPIEPTDFELGEPFTLQYGKQKFFTEGHLRVGFSEIVAEGRCPIGVVCVWEGRADIKIWFGVSRAAPDTVLVSIYGYTTAADTMRHQSAPVHNYRIVLMQLDPYPDTRIRIRPEDYIAMLRIDSVAD
jgi:hypothetical protein